MSGYAGLKTPGNPKQGIGEWRECVLNSKKGNAGHAAGPAVLTGKKVERTHEYLYWTIPLTAGSSGSQQTVLAEPRHKLLFETAMKEKLQEYALIAEIISSIVIFATLVILIIGVKENTEALQSSNVQSVAERSQLFALAVTRTPELAKIQSELMHNGNDTEQQQKGSLLVAALKLGEESFIQYKNGFLPEPYWETRANFVLAFLTSEESKKLYQQQLKFVLIPEYAKWIDKKLEDQSAQNNAVKKGTL